MYCFISFIYICFYFFLYWLDTHSHRSKPMALLIGKGGPYIRQPLLQQETLIVGVASSCYRHWPILLFFRKLDGGTSSVKEVSPAKSLSWRLVTGAIILTPLSQLFMHLPLATEVEMVNTTLQQDYFKYKEFLLHFKSLTSQLPFFSVSQYYCGICFHSFLHVYYVSNI